MVTTRSYFQALEQERRKIQVFQRELPLSYNLITRVIEAYKQQDLVGSNLEHNFHGESEIGEQTSPVLEEFLPSKMASSPSSGVEKSDLRSSLQLGTQTSDPPSDTKERCPRKVFSVRVNRNRHSKTKARRCWSPELHQKFLHALKQLGGSDLATPKQIKELMKVDDLTNDEVKSHLQKYRLHTRRPRNSQLEDAITAKSTKDRTRIHAPIARRISLM